MPRSQAERLWMIGGALLGFVMLLIGYFFFISPQRSNTSDVDGQVSSVQSSNDALQAKLDRLRAENQDLAQYVAKATQAKLALPDASGLSNFLRELQQIGGATRTDMTQLSAGNPVDVSTVVNPAPVATTSSTSNDPTKAAAAAPSGSLAGSGGVRVFALPITTTIAGSVDALNQFLTQLQSVQPRAVLVSHLTENTGSNNTSGGAPVAGSGLTTIQLQMLAFVSPSTAAAAAAQLGTAGK